MQNVADNSQPTAKQIAAELNRTSDRLGQATFIPGYPGVIGKFTEYFATGKEVWLGVEGRDDFGLIKTAIRVNGEFPA